jgi:Type IV secretory pathway, VirJ component
MKPVIILSFLLFVIATTSFAQSDDLPIQALKGSDLSKPLILYLSGDGGWNKFSTSFINTLNKQGYSIVALNSRSYFWKKKTPAKAAEEITMLLDRYLKSWKASSFVLVGYSFGADVAPFIQCNFNPYILDNLKHTVLMSPSDKTDFEIHVLGMLGFSNSGESVPNQINKLSKPVTIVLGTEEKDFSLNAISLKHYQTIKIEGGHHYDGHIDELVKKVTQTF